MRRQADRDLRGAAVAYVVDVLLVSLFAVVGRRSHHESLDVAGWWTTAWPFLLGLVLGWVLVRASLRRFPVTVGLGVYVWLATGLGGMAFRDMVGQGTALPFVIVALIVLGVFLLGARVIAQLIRRRTGGPELAGTDHDPSRRHDRAARTDPDGTSQRGRGVVASDAVPGWARSADPHEPGPPAH